ncbi:hypothetical protein RJ639_021957 [Escallonia herrerae]|uniref:Aminotransferase-like plant mobile domain-containing protein n=1 Tax=Escallonia herrerae TaxID=1293975 RepID=A0AA88V5J3_9ASTE|nr:hypothetical protein RJ639_021957 [Escallonia herrerae]
MKSSLYLETLWVGDVLCYEPVLLKYEGLYCWGLKKFIWQPYDLASLPEYCLTGRHVWMTQSLLIYFERVEWHFPNRVCLQYNMSQVIPRDCDTGDTIYGREAAGEYVDAGYSSPYMLWYRSITRLLVGRPVQNIPSGYQGGHATVLVLPSPSPVTAVEHVPLTSHSTIRTPPAYGPSASTLERSNRPHTPGSNAPISANETTAVHHMPSPLLHESEMEGIVKDIPSKIPPTSTDPLACYEMVQEQLEPIEKETHGSVPYHSGSSFVIAGS